VLIQQRMETTTGLKTVKPT